MATTLGGMATKKKKDGHKPARMVRIPERWAVALEELASEDENNLTTQVKAAVKAYLEGKGRLPKPGSERPKSSG